MEKEEDCIQFGNFCKDSQTDPYQCKDLKCVSSTQKCILNPALISPAQIEYDVKIGDDATINFAYKNLTPIARLKLPSGSMAVSTDTLTDTGGYQKLRFEPIPTLKLN